MAAYYNEHDPKAAAWLRELIKHGHIAPGIVDERSIEDVLPIELAGFTQCHFFAGIGVWSYALRKSGWPDNRQVWTGSCPCQPFSQAGKGKGTADERHLWPAWYHLIRECRPDVVFGEQVASKDGLAWLDIVQTDLEAENYACGVVDLCAAGVGAPHIRQRLWLVAESMGDTHGNRPQGRIHRRSYPQRETVHGQAGCNSTTFGLANHHGIGCNSGSQRCTDMGHGKTTEPNCSIDALSRTSRPGPVNGMWATADWLYCRDEKWRPVEPGTLPLADGAPSRVVRLRGYGNAINAEVASQFIAAYMESGQK